jgi:hypothetical protein
VAIRGNQSPSEALRGSQGPADSSVAISGNQRQSGTSMGQGPADLSVAQRLRRPSTEERLALLRARRRPAGSAEDTRLEGGSEGKPPGGKPPGGKPPRGKPPRGKPEAPRDRKRGEAPPTTPNTRPPPSQISPEIPSYQIRARASAEPATPLFPRACLRLLDEMDVDSIVIGCRNHAAISAGKASSPLRRASSGSTTEATATSPPRCSRPDSTESRPPRCSRSAADLSGHERSSVALRGPQRSSAASSAPITAPRPRSRADAPRPEGGRGVPLAVPLSAQHSAHLIGALTSSESKLSSADVPLESDRRPPRGAATPLERPPPRARQHHGQHFPPRARLGPQSPRAQLGVRETAVGDLHSHGLEA